MVNNSVFDEQLSISTSLSNTSSSSTAIQKKWEEGLDKIPIMRRLLGVISKNMIGIKLGGLYHKGKNSFTLEFTGILYIILFVYLVFADIDIL